MIYIHCNAGKGHRATYHDILNGYNCWCGRPFLATDDQKEAFLKQERAKREPVPEDPMLEAERQQQLAQEEHEAYIARRERLRRLNEEFYALQDLKKKQQEDQRKIEEERQLQEWRDLGFTPVDVE